MDRGLFRRLGGRPAIERIVEGLYDRLERDKDLRRLFGSRREGERARQRLFFEELFGGEARHSAEGHADGGMQRRHAHRAITEAEAERWLEHFGESMAAAGIDVAAQEDVIVGLRPAALRLTNGGAPFKTVLDAIALASKGRMEAVQGLVAQYPALVRQRGRDGVTLLWEAARRGHLPLVQWLAEQGADIDTPGSTAHATEVMLPPYVVATRARHETVARYLRTRGARVDIYAAAYLGDLELLAKLLRTDPSSAERPSADEDFYPVTPLHYAADGGQLEAMRLLIGRGAPVRPYSRRLLASAARQGSVEMVALLLAHGAGAHQVDDLGPIDQGDGRIASLLIEHGLDINRPVRGRETFLSRACRGDKGEHPLRVQTLLTLGADVNAPNVTGRTALHAAAKAGFLRVIALLLEHGADPAAADAAGATPLSVALAAGHGEAAVMLRAVSAKTSS